MYVTKKNIESALRVGKTTFASFLTMTNNGEFRPRRFKIGDENVTIYELDKAARFLARHSFRFDAESESRLRGSAFTLESLLEAYKSRMLAKDQADLDAYLAAS